MKKEMYVWYCYILYKRVGNSIVEDKSAITYVRFLTLWPRIYMAGALFYWFMVMMLSALVKVPRKQIVAAVEFEWQKASFCGDCKLRSNYDCTAAENLRARMLRFASALSPIGFRILIQSHRNGLTAVIPVL